ncbi:MAG: T9SS type A sorting domain-containing protein, partial [Bacteroidales bacterium]|nr:T9SS type A sorting domain-containing protein [Bacteroidales bacterium]
VFYIELPVDATIDIFATNGVLVRSINAKAGKTTLNLDHSGIYFLRIAGEGRATVKRVIVR